MHFRPKFRRERVYIYILRYISYLYYCSVFVHHSIELNRDYIRRFIVLTIIILPYATILYYPSVEQRVYASHYSILYTGTINYAFVLQHDCTLQIFVFQREHKFIIRIVAHTSLQHTNCGKQSCCVRSGSVPFGSKLFE